MFSPTNFLIPHQCSECGVWKSSEEELELHLKVDHLKWLPFECPKCGEQRALGTHMRDHIHSNNHGDTAKFLYIDNPSAKQQLIQWMQLSRSKRNVSVNSSSSNVMTPTLALVDKESSSSGRLSSSAPLIFPWFPSQPIKMEDDEIDQPSPSPKKRPIGEENDISYTTLAERSNTSSDQWKPHCFRPSLQSAAKKVKTEWESWSSDGDSSPEEEQIVELNPVGLQLTVSKLPQRVVAGKVRCRKCEIKIPAQDCNKKRHALIHLSKDYQVYRFYCLFAGCGDKQYRKDQVERHQIKAHGQVDQSKIEDTIKQLADTIAEVAEDLFSCNASAVTANSGVAAVSSPVTESTLSAKRRVLKARPTSQQLLNRALPVVDVSDTLNSQVFSRFCKLCAKAITCSRLLHVSWHLHKDDGISRYHCSQCEFSCDRAVRIRVHSEKKHNSANTKIDKTADYQEEIEAKMEECFERLPSPKSDNKSNQSQKASSWSADSALVTCQICASKMLGKARGQHVFLHLCKDKGIYRYQCSKCDVGSDRRLFVQRHSQEEHNGANAVVDQLVQCQEAFLAQNVECFGGKMPLINGCKSTKQQPVTIQSKKDARAARWLNRSSGQELKESPRWANGEESQSAEPTESTRKSSAASGDYTCCMCLEADVTDMAKHSLKHVDKPIFKCPKCDFNRQVDMSGIKKHMRQKHPNSRLKPIDNRSLYAADVEETRRICFPGHFAVDKETQRDAFLTSESLNGSDNDFVIIEEAACSICNQTLPAGSSNRLHKYRHKFVRQKCWCSPQCDFNPLKPGWLHCEECAHKLLFSETFNVSLENRF